MTKILTYPNEFYADNYSRKSNLMEQYRQNTLLFCKQSLPNVSEEELLDIIKVIIREQYKASEVKYLASEGSCNIKAYSDNLLETTNSLNHDILSPYGATYCQVSELVSVFSEHIDDEQKTRKILKKEMYLAEAADDRFLVKLKDLFQRNVKIGINLLSGVMLSNVSFRSSINYNAITATARFNIMTAYASTEMSFASNYYLYNENKAINWIINLLRIYPGDDRISECIAHYKLAIPTREKVFSAYANQVWIYSSASNLDAFKGLIDSLSPLELIFVYYAINFKRIFQDNPHFKERFSYIINPDNVTLVEGDFPQISKLEDDLIHALTVVILSSLIGKKTMVSIDKDHPELARKIYSTYIFIEKNLNEFKLLFETLTMLPIVPSDIGIHKNMIRKTVLLSDTDSILFTNIDWVNWYAGDIKITDDTSRFNSLIVLLISKHLEHVFAYMSASMNIGVEHIKTLAIKNEFVYDLFLRTPISKHYAGYVRYKEGVFQDPYKFDLKGKNFKGSDLCKETTSYVKWFIRYIFDNYLLTYELHPEDLISKVIIFEQRIKLSIAQGEVTFLMQKPINLKERYKNPDSSDYLYYELWQAVFAEKYGNLNLPQKTKELPIESIGIKDTTHLNHIKGINKDIYDRFIAFIAKYPKRTFSRVLIPMDIPVPEELRAVANYRKVCASNCFSLELILKSFNIVNYPNSKRIVLFSDIYPSIMQEITDEQRDQVTRTAAAYVEEESNWGNEDDEEDFDEEDLDECGDDDIDSDDF